MSKDVDLILFNVWLCHFLKVGFVVTSESSLLLDVPPYYRDRGARVKHRTVSPPLDRVAHDVAGLDFDRVLLWVCSA